MTDQEQPARVVALGWGVKQSFRSYVEAVGGVIKTRDGAERAPDGGFVFVAAPGPGLSLEAEGGSAGHGAFLGEVRFEAHGGMLSVGLADPALEIGPDGAVLTVADAGAGGRRLAIARLDLTDITTGEDGEVLVPAALTIDGSQILGDHYPPTTALDPVRLILARR